MIAALLSRRNRTRTEQVCVPVLSADDRLIRVVLDTPSLDVRTADRWLRAVVREGVPGRLLAVDMSRVRVLDSTGLGAIVGAVKSAHAGGFEVCLYAVTGEVRGLLELVRLHQLVDIYNDAAEVIRCVHAGPATGTQEQTS